MKGARLLLLPAAWLLSVAASPPVTILPTPTPVPAPSPTHSPTPSPTPTPSTGVLNLSPTLGTAQTLVTVQGSQFRAGEAVTLYWDTPDKSLGSVTADAQGSFKLDIHPPAADPGQHSICAAESNPGPRCATFKLDATPSPSPSPSATVTPSPAASATDVPSAQPTPVLVPDGPVHTTAVSSLLSPPFVFVPVLVLLALLGGIGYWIWSGTRSRRPAPVLSASVVHHKARAPLGAPIPAGRPGAPAGTPSEPPPPASPPAPPPAPRGPVAAPSDEAVEFPEPGD